MKIKDKRLKAIVKPISLWDKIKADMCKYENSFDDHSQFYDDWLEDFLDQGVEVIDITLYCMALRNSNGEVERFSTPPSGYQYGAKYGGSYVPTRKLQLQLRELQLTKREELIELYKKEVL